MSQVQLKQSGGGYTEQGGTADAGHVRPRPGPKTLARPRTRANVTSVVPVHFPAGADITELVVSCWPTSAPANDYVNDNLVGILAIDAPDDATAAIWVFDGTTTLPDSATDDQPYFIIPLNQIVRIPLTAALKNGLYGGGRVDVKALDEATGLNWSIVGN